MDLADPDMISFVHKDPKTKVKIDHHSKYNKKPKVYHFSQVDNEQDEEDIQEQMFGELASQANLGAYVLAAAREFNS